VKNDDELHGMWKGFYRDSGRSGCWSHHVAFGGVPCAPKKITPKRLVTEPESGGDHDG